MRIWIAGILGGIAMFIWAGIAHDALGLGSVGMKTLRDPAVAALKADTANAPGIYIFPGDMKAKAGPSGIMVYNPGLVSMDPATLIKEALSEIVQAVILAFVLSWLAMTGLGARVGAAALIGVAAAMTTSASYWIWYRFPTGYTAAYMLVDWLRYVIAGVVIALILKRKPVTA